MEKRRRARINASLGELKSLLQEAIKKEGARHNKMEKADILEMAVKHLRQIQRQQVNGDSFSDQMVINKYILGFNACAQEVSKYLDGDVDLKARLLNHLANCITGTSSQNTDSSCLTPLSIKETSCTATSSTPISPVSMGTISPTSTSMSPEIQRNETRTVISTTFKNDDLSALNSTEQGVQGFRVPQALDIKVPNILNTLNESFTSKLENTRSVNNSFSTSSENSFPVLVNSPQISYLRQGVADMNNNSKSNHDNSEVISMPEVNNNTISFPTVMGIRGAATLPLNQQQLHQLQIQPVQQVQNLSEIPIDHNHQTVLQDSSILSNRLQFIPMKIANGETALVLSAANFVSPSQLSGYSFQVYAPQSQPQIFTQPLQIAQIAVAFPQEEHQQTLAYIPQVSQPQSTILSTNFDSTQSKLSIAMLDHHSVPLNLTSSSQKSPEKHSSPRSSSVLTPPSNTFRTSNVSPNLRASTSLSEVSTPFRMDQQEVSHNECTSTTATASPMAFDAGFQSTNAISYTSFGSPATRELTCSQPLPTSKASQLVGYNWNSSSSNDPQDQRVEFRPSSGALELKKPDYFRPW